MRCLAPQHAVVVRRSRPRVWRLAKRRCMRCRSCGRDAARAIVAALAVLRAWQEVDQVRAATFRAASGGFVWPSRVPPSGSSPNLACPGASLRVISRSPRLGLHVGPPRDSPGHLGRRPWTSSVRLSPLRLGPPRASSWSASDLFGPSMASHHFGCLLPPRAHHTPSLLGTLRVGPPQAFCVAFFHHLDAPRATTFGHLIEWRRDWRNSRSSPSLAFSLSGDVCPICWSFFRCFSASLSVVAVVGPLVLLRLPGPSLGALFDQNHTVAVGVLRVMGDGKWSQALDHLRQEGEATSASLDRCRCTEFVALSASNRWHGAKRAILGHSYDHCVRSLSSLSSVPNLGRLESAKLPARSQCPLAMPNALREYATGHMTTPQVGATSDSSATRFEACGHTCA